MIDAGFADYTPDLDDEDDGGDYFRALERYDAQPKTCLGRDMDCGRPLPCPDHPGPGERPAGVRVTRTPAKHQVRGGFGSPEPQTDEESRLP